MDRLLGVLFGGKKFPLRRFFSLRVGTTIVGELDWVLLVGVEYIVPRPMPLNEYGYVFTSSVFLLESDIMTLTLLTFKIIFFFTAQKMIIGNVKGNKELMLPFVDIKLIQLSALMTLYVILLPLAYLAEDRPADAVITFGISIVVMALSVYFLWVVQYRIREINTEAYLTHYDVENSTYGTDGDTLEYCAKGHEIVPLINDSLVSLTDVGSQILCSSTHCTSDSTTMTTVAVPQTDGEISQYETDNTMLRVW